jgi:hypothetical protein
MLSIFSYTTLMDRHRGAIPAEIARAALGLGLIYYFSGWFGLEEWFAGAALILAIYFVISLGLTVYFSLFEDKGERLSPIASR